MPNPTQEQMDKVIAQLIDIKKLLHQMCGALGEKATYTSPDSY